MSAAVTSASCLPSFAPWDYRVCSRRWLHTHLLLSYSLARCWERQQLPCAPQFGVSHESAPFEPFQIGWDERNHHLARAAGTRVGSEIVLFFFNFSNESGDYLVSSCAECSSVLEAQFKTSSQNSSSQNSQVCACYIIQKFGIVWIHQAGRGAAARKRLGSAEWNIISSFSTTSGKSI